MLLERYLAFAHASVALAVNPGESGDAAGPLPVEVAPPITSITWRSHTSAGGRSR
jgi:hypothetical protein